VTTPGDFLSIPFSPDLVNAGISYISLSIPRLYRSDNTLLRRQLHATLCNIAAELALRRYLTSKGIHYQTIPSDPLVDPNQYDILITRRHCRLSNYVIHEEKTYQISNDAPPLWFDTPVLFPSKHLASDFIHNHDPLIFTRIEILFTQPQSNNAQNQSSEPVCFIHPLPVHWHQPKYWTEIGDMIFYNGGIFPINIKIGGRNEQGNFLIDEITLPPHDSILYPNSLYSLAYFQMNEAPTGQLTFQCKKFKQNYTIGINQWTNLQIESGKIIFLGYQLADNFRRLARPFNPRIQSLPYPFDESETYLYLPISKLHPLEELIENIRKQQKGG
jgi:hypothetical protein